MGGKQQAVWQCVRQSAKFSTLFLGKNFPQNISKVQTAKTNEDQNLTQLKAIKKQN